MKLPRFTLRELFLLVVIAALALGWFLSWGRYRLAYLNSLNDAKLQKAHAEAWKLAIQAKGYLPEYDEKKGYTLTKIEDMTALQRSAWHFRAHADEMAESERAAWKKRLEEMGGPPAK